MANKKHLEKLREGVVAWNAWVEKQGHDFVANLIGANLNGADLSRAKLTRANLNGAYLGRTILNDANLSMANLQGAIMRDVDLSEANLSQANLHRAFLREVNMNEANLSKANLSEANFDGIHIRSAVLDGVIFSKTHVSDEMLDSKLKIDGDHATSSGVLSHKLYHEDKEMIRVEIYLPDSDESRPTRNKVVETFAEEFESRGLKWLAFSCPVTGSIPAKLLVEGNKITLREAFDGVFTRQPNRSLAQYVKAINATDSVVIHGGNCVAVKWANADGQTETLVVPVTEKQSKYLRSNPEILNTPQRVTQFFKLSAPE